VSLVSDHGITEPHATKFPPQQRCQYGDVTFVAVILLVLIG